MSGTLGLKGGSKIPDGEGRLLRLRERTNTWKIRNHLMEREGLFPIARKDLLLWRRSIILSAEGGGLFFTSPRLRHSKC
jgi:hypothetical protein